MFLWVLGFLELFEERQVVGGLVEWGLLAVELLVWVARELVLIQLVLELRLLLRAMHLDQ